LLGHLLFCWKLLRTSTLMLYQGLPGWHLMPNYRLSALFKAIWLENAVWHDFFFGSVGRKKVAWFFLKTCLI